MVKRSVKDIKKEYAKKCAIIIAIFAFAMVGLRCFSIIVRNNTIKNSVRSNANVEKLVGINTEVDIEQVEGLISPNELLEITTDKIEEVINGYKKLLGEDKYNYMLELINSSYFKFYCIASYEDLVSEVEEMKEQAKIIDELYEISFGASEVNDSECVNKSCNTKEFIELYCIGELQDSLINTHFKYEALVRKAMSELDNDELESYVQRVYENHICTSGEYIDDIEVRVWRVSASALEAGISDIQFAFEKEYLDSEVLGIEELSEIKNLELYRDKKWFNDELKQRAPSVFLELNKEELGIVNVTDVVDIEEWLKNNAPVESEEKYEWILDKNYIVITPTDENIGEQVYILWEIVYCNRKDVPELEDIRESMEEIAKLQLAEEIVQLEILEHVHEH